MSSDEEKELMVREVREVFRGRFDSEGAKRILEHVNWEKQEAITFVLENEARDITRIATMSEDTVNALKTDPEVLEAFRGGVKSVVRQFACEQCDHVWWWRVPIRKEVSKCKMCKQKYDPIPRENEWGWATFDCDYCGNQFSGFGEMNVTISQCYCCGRDVIHPTSISRKNRRGNRRERTGNTHSCLGIGCGHHDEVPIHANVPGRIYDDDEDNAPGQAANGNVLARGVGQLNINQPIRGRGGGRGRNRRQETFYCVHPDSRKKRVVHASQPHDSTGSTVGTFLPQDDIASTYVPSLPSIREERGRGRGRGRRGRGGRR